MQFYLRNKNVDLAKFDLSAGVFDTVYLNNVVELHPSANKILHCSVADWILNRKPYTRRRELVNLLAKLGIRNQVGYFCSTYGVSLNDTLWVCPANNSKLSWERVSPYTNPLNESIAHYAFDGCGLITGSVSPEYTTNGCLPKCWKRVNGSIYLYKGGSSGVVNTGREPYSEVYAIQLLRALGIPKVTFVEYTLGKYHNRVVSKCKLFTSEEYGFLSQYRYNPISVFGQLIESQLEGQFSDFFRAMYIFDALILNVDRHQSNYGYLVRNSTGEVVAPAQIFDNGLGCLTYFYSNAEGKQFEIDFREFVQSRDTSAGFNFVEVAKYCLIPSLQRKLVDVSNFKFTPIKGDDPMWAELLTRVLHDQVRKILKK